MIETIAQIMILLLGCGWVGNVILAFFQRKRVKASANLDDATATQVLVGTATSMLAPLSTRINELESEAVGLRKELKQAKDEMHRLNRSLYEANQRLEQTTAENQRITAENRVLRLRLQNESTG